MKANIAKPTGGSQLWLEEMAQAHPNAVKSFQHLMQVNGFNTIGHAFAQINKSFPMVDTFYVFTDVIFPINQTKVIENLQNYLQLAFENFEELYAADNSIVSHNIFQKKMDTREIVGVIAVTEVQKVSVEALDKDWMSEMKNSYPTAAPHFLRMLSENGFDSLDAACADIESSFPLIERYLSNNGVQAPLRLKEDTLALQDALAVAYRNSEEQCLEMAM